MSTRKYNITLDGSTYSVEARNISGNQYGITLEGVEYNVGVEEVIPESITTHINGIDVVTTTETGSQITPNVINDGTVTEDIDYSVSYGENTNPGIGYVFVNGINDYSGSVTYTFTITAATQQIGDHITGISPESVEYTGSEIEPTVLTDGSVTEDEDYTVEYEDNVNVGTGKVTITGINSYTGSVSYQFTITARDITSHISGISPVSTSYTGSEIKPTVLTDGTVVLNTDYSVAYSDNVEIGTGKVDVTGINTYTGTKNYTFEITTASIGDHVTGLTQTSFEYTGSEIKPTLVTDGTVTETEDYTVAYTDNTEIGTGKVTVTGINDYNGTATYEFTITGKNIDSHITGLSGTSFDYTGSEIKPTVQNDGTVVENTDYTVEYSDNTNAGEATVTVTGINTYAGTTKELNFTINPISISSHITGLSSTTETYNGSEIKPTVVDDGTVILDTDYIVEYQNCVAAGSATAVVTGIDNYTGYVNLAYTINPAPIAGHITGIDKTTAVYNGTAITPAVNTDGTVTENTDYTVVCTDNINVGTAKVTVTGTTNYTGSLEYSFTITAADIADYVYGIDCDEYVLATGSQIKPDLVKNSSVAEGTDYNVTYGTNTDAGTTGTVTVTGINNFAGSSKEFTFQIIASYEDISSHITGLDPTSATYTGEEIEPTVLNDGTVTLDTDYEVEYSDNVEVGTGKATVSGIGKYKGSSKELTFTITV